MNNNKPTHNPSRSLEMVVSVSVEDCAEALHTLHKDGWFKRESVFVKTYRINDDLYQFEVWLKIKRGKSPTMTPLRGTLRYDSSAQATQVSGEVQSKQGDIYLLLAVGGILFVVMFVWMFLEPAMVILMLMLTVIIPFILMTMVNNDKQDTQRVISMTQQVLRLTQSGKSSRIASVDSSESPFYEDDDYQNGTAERQT